MALRITDRNFSRVEKDGKFIFTELPVNLDGEGSEIPYRQFGEFLIVDTDSGKQWGCTAQSLAELQRVKGRALANAVKQKDRAASAPEPTKPTEPDAESEDSQQYERDLERYDEDVKSHGDRIASTEAAYFKKQDVVDDLAARRTLIEGKLTDAGVKATSLAKVFRGETLEESDFN